MLQHNVTTSLSIFENMCLKFKRNFVAYVRGASSYNKN